MANKEHLAILKQGVEVWNEWVWDNFVTQADLQGADLAGMYLYQARLGEADLRGANLSEAHLVNANLIGADLAGADLSKAVLSKALLVGGDLRQANLTEADLTEAHLLAANLSRARLSQMVLTEAMIGGNEFIDVDLSTVKGMETVTHETPSYIDIHTLYRSKGQIPEAFLRGCGVPDTFVEFARSLALSERAIDYFSCFISYSSQDEDFAQHLHADLQDNGVRCWFAPEDMKIGDKIRQRIDESIRIHDKLLLVLSDNSIDSQWVEKEVETAWEEESRRGVTVLFPVRLDDSVFETKQAWAADVRRLRHIGDFRSWQDHDSYQEAFGRLLRDLKAAS